MLKRGNACGLAAILLSLINGGFDPISGAHVAERFGQLLPRAAVYRMPGIGHYPQVEVPERVVESYRAFVERLK